jgi:hypothetical protein
MLIGIDGLTRNGSAHLQAVVHLGEAPRITLANAVVKIYPANPDEHANLIGWRICQELNSVPDQFRRRVKTNVGTILTLVCHDAVVLSPRSQSVVKGQAQDQNPTALPKSSFQ